LIGRLATFARVNEYGFIETPYRRVVKSISSKHIELEGCVLLQDVVHPKSGDVLAKEGTRVDADMAKKISKFKIEGIAVKPFVSMDPNLIEYLSADAEDKFVIAQANAELNEFNEFTHERISCRYHSDFVTRSPENINYMDVAPHQVVGVSASLIPFLEHDDANRALMGSNMMAQAVPLVQPDIPMVSTGMEAFAAIDSGPY
jgi:DNA-directed RNA polymerase subunit beta